MGRQSPEAVHYRRPGRATRPFSRVLGTDGQGAAARDRDHGEGLGCMQRTSVSLPSTFYHTGPRATPPRDDSSEAHIFSAASSMLRVAPGSVFSSASQYRTLASPHEPVLPLAMAELLVIRARYAVILLGMPSCHVNIICLSAVVYLRKQAGHRQNFGMRWLRSSNRQCCRSPQDARSQTTETGTSPHIPTTGHLAGAKTLSHGDADDLPASALGRLIAVSLRRPRKA